MNINVNNLTYNFDGDKTISVTVGFYGTESQSFINANIALNEADLLDGKTFDDVTKKELTELARNKLTGFVTTKESGE